MQIKKIVLSFDVILAVAALAVLWGTITLQIILRQFFLLPLMGAEEMASWMVVWIILTPLAFTERINGHIVMEELQILMPLVVRKIIRFVSAICTTGVYIVVSISVMHVFANNLNNVTASLRIPFLLFFLPCAIGFVGISLVRVTSHICTLLKKEQPWTASL